MKTSLFSVALLCVFGAWGQKQETSLKAGDIENSTVIQGNYNSIVTNVFNKSVEYKELQQALATLEADIQKKANECADMERDQLPAKYREGCRSDLIVLNARRDSVAKIESRFKEDVIRLAESFAKIPLNSRRLVVADSLFRIGKIREAEVLLNFKEITREGDALLAKRDRDRQTLQLDDSLLLVKANELALKAQLKATDYGDSLRYDSAEMYFLQSLRYGETLEHLWHFAWLLDHDNQPNRAVTYYERALKAARSESEVATLANNLGSAYSKIQKIPEAEKMYLRSLEIYERLAKINSAQFESGLAMTGVNLGIFYSDLQRIPEAEKTLLRSLEIYERLTIGNPAQFEPNLAAIATNLGVFYHTAQRMPEAEKMYLFSLEIYNRLVKNNPVQFELPLAVAAMNLGNLYKTMQRIPEAEKMYLHSLEIYERRAQINPSQFEPELALTAMNLGNFYRAIQRTAEAEKMLLRSLEIYDRLVKSNPSQFEPELAATATSLGNFYQTVQKMPEAEKIYLRSLEIYERCVKNSPVLFEPDLALTVMNLGTFYTTVRRMPEAEKMYLRSLEIYERRARINPSQFEPELAKVLKNLGYFYEKQGRLGEAHQRYSSSLNLRQKRVLAGQTYFLQEVVHVYYNLASIRDSFALRGEWGVVVEIQRECSACLDSLKHLSKPLTQQAPQEHGLLSYYCLFAKQYPESQSAAERALTLNPNLNWVRTNLGHSHLLRHDWKTAKQVYTTYLQNEADPAAAKIILLKDLDDLEAKGITCPEMTQARAWLRE